MLLLMTLLPILAPVYCMDPTKLNPYITDSLVNLGKVEINLNLNNKQLEKMVKPKSMGHDHSSLLHKLLSGKNIFSSNIPAPMDKEETVIFDMTYPLNPIVHPIENELQVLPAIPPSYQKLDPLSTQYEFFFLPNKHTHKKEKFLRDDVKAVGDIIDDKPKIENDIKDDTIKDEAVKEQQEVDANFAPRPTKGKPARQ